MLARSRAQRPLTADQMTRAMERMIGGAMPAKEIRTFLLDLAKRGETAEEIAAGAQCLRAHAVRLPLPSDLELCDTCGTGGDQRHTVNVSTLAAIVAASCGARICKHGNRAASSRCGSADVLEALGLNLDASPEAVAHSIQTVGFGFCFAPRFHPAMKTVAPIRKELGIRTIFNLIGPLANPAPLAFQLVGVADPSLMLPTAHALIRLGVRHGMVVHGLDGLDEVTTTGQTRVVELRGKRLETSHLRPSDFGIAQARLEELQGQGPEENARLAREILQGQRSPRRDLVVLNAGCVLYVAQRARSIQEGIAMAKQAIDAGRAHRLLEAAVRLSREAA
ncbi:MAG: anthranilate phosphoribosyltransferase [Candidatus Omnitrophica bacterium]|nr:anthranilate phosphoribosyltransferase [Candidatus Omnitrophota bacterium]